MKTQPILARSYTTTSSTSTENILPIMNASQTEIKVGQQQQIKKNFSISD